MCYYRTKLTEVIRIGIQNPLDERGSHLAIIEIKDRAVVTSGNYERYFIEDGKNIIIL